MTCTGQTEAARHHEEVAYREVVLPELRRVINTAPEYADVRRVYLARVAAEWYRERSEHTRTQFGHMIDSRSVAGWTSRQPWSVRAVFDRYVDSCNRKEFNVNREVVRGNTKVVTTFVYGGVDLSRIPMTRPRPTRPGWSGSDPRPPHRRRRLRRPRCPHREPTPGLPYSACTGSSRSSSGVAYWRTGSSCDAEWPGDRTEPDGHSVVVATSTKPWTSGRRSRRRHATTSGLGATSSTGTTAIPGARLIVSGASPIEFDHSTA